MRAYELVIIISPELEETGTAELVDKIKGWISDTGGSIESSEDWGRKKFSYMINNHKEGQYFLFNLKLDPSTVVNLERNFRLQETILRFLITVQEEQEQ